MSLEHKTAVLDVLLTALDETHAHALIDHRRAKRAPLTVYAAQLLVKQFARCVDPNEAADEMILRNWTGFKPEWIKERDMTRHGPRTGSGMIDALSRVRMQ
ncbi:MAG: hypothetical protein M9939_00790 [Mesorhizobium sp.]|nr:hypothetical protein [Mesorhizobium sp.]MCO5159644.1 hypothetical protein [Mesorhizobium sp.]